MIICYICIFKSDTMFEFYFKPCAKVIKIDFHFFSINFF